MSSVAGTLLADAPAGRHFCQFHRSEEALAGSVVPFLEGGLRRGNSVVVIASPDHSDRFLARLTDADFHPQALRQAGQLEVLDAAALLERCLSNGMPEWGRFHTTITTVLERVKPFGRGVRVYTEMASLLWGQGQTAASLKLEDFWNALARVSAFSQYCAYMLDTQREESYAGPLEELGRAHTEILGTLEDEAFGVALDRASKDIFGISLSQMAGTTRLDGARRFPSGQRTMLWVKRNLPLSTAQLAEKARRYFQGKGA